MNQKFELNHSLDYLYSPTYLATGSAISITSNRISYFFDWHGPSVSFIPCATRFSVRLCLGIEDADPTQVTIDTACSSSLVALQLAVQQLRCGESKVAVAAGANLLLSPCTFNISGIFSSPRVTLC